ncbi:MAG: hypothetical protein NT038_04820 [Euryarchaeota archaeon]|nr:hypothetical protein [Euryarchaeota archaeon]
MIEVIHYISIVIEAIIALFGLFIALQKKKIYGWGFFVTFAIYVFYDLSRLIPLNLSAEVLYPLFFVATISMLWGVWKIYRKE